MRLTHAGIAALAALAAGQALACYTVYDRNNKIVYNAVVAPVDMSRPLHETMPAKFPGGHLVFTNGDDCPRDTGGVGGVLRMSSENGRSPLLTDAKSAAAMGLRGTPIGNGAVMVRERPDSMRPGTVIAESGLPANPTAAMGAGPVPPQPQQDQHPQQIRPLTVPQPAR
jgi:hypothetical protein